MFPLEYSKIKMCSLSISLSIIRHFQQKCIFLENFKSVLLCAVFEHETKGKNPKLKALKTS